MDRYGRCNAERVRKEALISILENNQDDYIDRRQDSTIAFLTVPRQNFKGREVPKVVRPLKELSGELAMRMQLVTLFCDDGRMMISRGGRRALTPAPMGTCIGSMRCVGRIPTSLSASTAR